MNIIVNGNEREVPPKMTVRELLDELRLDPQRLAVEYNHQFLACTDFGDTRLREGDRIEIVQFVGGG